MNNDSSSGLAAKRHLNKIEIKYLAAYFVYAGIVLFVGTQFGVFGQRSLSHVDIIRNTAQSNRSDGLISTNPLPPRILIFDKETKETTVHDGESHADFVFNFRNTAKQNLVINRVETSCGCTVAKVPQLPWVLKSRERGQIAVSMNILGKVGKTSKEITIYSDQGYKSVQVTAIIESSKKLD